MFFCEKYFTVRNCIAVELLLCHNFLVVGVTHYQGFILPVLIMALGEVLGFLRKKMRHNIGLVLTKPHILQ